MRDPMTLAHRIVNPIPRISKNRKLGTGAHNDIKFGWTVRLKPFANHNYVSPFIYLFGYELYFSSFIELWHIDPLGDAGPPCHGRKYWKWHIQHMKLRLTFWQSFKQRHITRCAWCGNKSNAEQGRVNHSDHRTVYHSKCMSEKNAAYHAHDPLTCWGCKHAAEQEALRSKPE